MLLDQTTGSGKTYFSIKFANEYLQRHQNQRIIFTVNTKINIPEQEDKFDVKVQKMAIVTQGAGRIQRCHIKFPKTIFFIDEEMINGYPWKDINYTLSSNIFIDSSELLPPTKLCFVEVEASYFSEKSCKIKKVL